MLLGAATCIPRDPRVHFLLGYVCLCDITGKASTKAGARARAAREYLTAIRLDPTYAEAHMRLACLYAEDKDFRKANAEVDAYLRLVSPNVAERQEIKGTLNWIRKHK